jgi:hypothetical protein
MADLSDDSTAPATRAHNPRPHNRRLFGKVLIAFYKACDDGDFEVATILLDVLHRLVSSSDASRPADRRRSEYALIVASKMLNKLADDGWPPKGAMEPAIGRVVRRLPATTDPRRTKLIWRQTAPGVRISVVPSPVNRNRLRHTAPSRTRSGYHSS